MHFKEKSIEPRTNRKQILVIVRPGIAILEINTIRQRISNFKFQILSSIYKNIFRFDCSFDFGFGVGVDLSWTAFQWSSILLGQIWSPPMLSSLKFKPTWFHRRLQIKILLHISLSNSRSTTNSLFNITTWDLNHLIRYVVQICWWRLCVNFISFTFSFSFCWNSHHRIFTENWRLKIVNWRNCCQLTILSSLIKSIFSFRSRFPIHIHT
jgi:hypothetical protein